MKHFATACLGLAALVSDGCTRSGTAERRAPETASTASGRAETKVGSSSMSNGPERSAPAIPAPHGRNPIASRCSPTKSCDTLQVYHEELVEFVTGLRQAVLKNSPEEVARFMRYPLGVQAPAGMSPESEQEFVRQYNTIVTPCVRASLLRLDAERIHQTRYGRESEDGILMFLWAPVGGPWQVDSIGNVWCDKSPWHTSPSQSGQPRGQ